MQASENFSQSGISLSVELVLLRHRNKLFYNHQQCGVGIVNMGFWSVLNCYGHNHITQFLQINFFRGGQSRHFAIFFRLLAMQRKLTHTKKKMFSVTATVAYSVFLVRKLCIEQMFVLASMDINPLTTTGAN